VTTWLRAAGVSDDYQDYYYFLVGIGRKSESVATQLLGLVLCFGEEVGGARRWFHLGRWSLQPSEFAQLSLVLYLSDVLARKADQLQDFWRGLLPPLLATGLVAGMVLLQPDLGTAIAMGTVALLLLGVAKARWQHLGAIMAVACVVLVFLVAGEEYRRRRILTFLDPWQDPQGSGYQILQSYYALASGGLLGTGLGGSFQKLFYLPSAHTDFIFAILGEELGLVGTTAVIGLFALFVTCGFRIAMAANDLFSKYLVCGLVGMLGLEAMVNIAVVTGLLPTKGLPLPFISYGGTSMVTNLIACAAMFHASRHGERFSLEGALGR
jgi:cell division protein FtsW